MRYPYTVLILEDHPLQCVCLRELLQEAGFQHVEVAQCAAHALALLTQSHYDLILLDLDLPEMDGMQFIDELSKLHKDVAIAISSTCPPMMRNCASHMARDMNLTVIGSFAKPLSQANAHQLGEHLLKQSHSSKAELSEQLPSPKQTFTAKDIETAIRQRQIMPWFQPKFCLSDGRINGLEVLARWHHPEAGILTPNLFMPSIERLQLEGALLHHMLDTALQASQQWRAHQFHIPISINLPPHLLEQTSLPDQLLWQVQQHRLAAQDITFELTENTTTTKPGSYHMGANRLRLKGFGLSQDDFGIGFSSLHSLTCVPFTEMKIDKSFINGVAHKSTLATITTTAIQLGQRLGLQVTAEGVETSQDLHFLSKAGVTCAQGFLLSRPVPAHTLLGILQANRRHPSPYLHH